MQKLQQAALASDAPAAQAAAPLLACVDLENRKHLHGLADGPGISGDVLSEVGSACCPPHTLYPCRYHAALGNRISGALIACSVLKTHGTQGDGSVPGQWSRYTSVGIWPVRMPSSCSPGALLACPSTTVKASGQHSRLVEPWPSLCRRSWSGWSLAGLQGPLAISTLRLSLQPMALRPRRWCTFRSWATWRAVLPASGELTQCLRGLHWPARWQSFS